MRSLFFSLAVLLLSPQGTLNANPPETFPIADCLSSRPPDGDNWHLPSRRVLFVQNSDFTTGHAIVYPASPEGELLSEEGTYFPIWVEHSIGEVRVWMRFFPETRNSNQDAAEFILPREESFVLDIRRPISPWHSERWDILQCRRTG